jgi:hypothetical protein
LLFGKLLKKVENPQQSQILAWYGRTEAIDDRTYEECHFDNANIKTLNTIFVAVGPGKFKWISTCEYTKDAWRSCKLCMQKLVLSECQNYRC